jgi:hypothetical protein
MCIFYQHYALSYITPLLDTQASTCFGIHVPSSGSFLCLRELLESRNVYVVCLKVYHGYINWHSDMVHHIKIINITIHGVSRNSRSEDISKYTTPNKRVWKLPTSTQLPANWHTDSLDVVVLTSTGASRHHKCCRDGSTSPKYFGCTLVWILIMSDDITGDITADFSQ